MAALSGGDEDVVAVVTFVVALVSLVVINIAISEGIGKCSDDDENSIKGNEGGGEGGGVAAAAAAAGDATAET